MESGEKKEKENIEQQKLNWKRIVEDRKSKHEKRVESYTSLPPQHGIRTSSIENEKHNLMIPVALAGGE